MLSFLQTHPFPVQAYFERSLVLTFAYPKAQVQALLPPYLTLDTWHDEWAFVAVALVQTRGLRPQGFPAALGNNFSLAGYRVFARYRTSAGKRLRGLYILKSQTDKRRMALLGNLFTYYNYETVPMTFRSEEHQLTVSFGSAAVTVAVGATDETVALPPHSPFADWQEARRFAGPLPFTFAYHAPARSVVIVEGMREHWQPVPVTVTKLHVPLLASLGLGSGGIVASAFLVQNIPYRWKKGRLDLWPH